MKLPVSAGRFPAPSGLTAGRSNQAERRPHGSCGRLRTIADSGIDRAILTPRRNPQLAHNKFIVYGTKAADGSLTPVSVWTGSTNLSTGGIFGHSNVGHVVRDPAVAGRYLGYWNELSGDPQVRDLRRWMAANNSFDGGGLQVSGIHTVFSPRTGLAPLTWYAQQFTGAPRAGHITLPFGLTAAFEQPLDAYEGEALHHPMARRPLSTELMWSRIRDPADNPTHRHHDQNGDIARLHIIPGST